MIIVAALGILAGAMTLVLASVVLRAGQGRPDNRLFAAMASLAGVVALGMAVDKVDAAPLLPRGLGTLALVVEALTAGMSVLFAYAFPRGRTPTRWLWIVASAVVAGGLWLAFGCELGASPRTMTPWLLLPPYVLSVALLLRQLPHVAAGSRAGLWIVAGTLASRWLLGSVFAHLGLTVSSHTVPGLSLPEDAVGVLQMLVIGWVILRYHLLDVRRVFREAAVAWVAAIGVAGYAAFVLTMAPWLRLQVGDEGTALAVVLPLVVAAWVGWTWRDDVGAAARALDPHRGVRREIMERVLAVTGYVVDPEAVLAMIRAAMLELFPNAQVDFRRARGSRLLHGISATLSANVEAALQREDASAVDVASLMQRHDGLRGIWPETSRRILLPVRRDAVLYGVFELEVVGRVDSDDLLTASAMADHLAVKLENVSLSSSLGQAGRELESIRTFLEDMVESLPVGIVGISGPNLEVRLWNPFEEKRTGIQASEVLGKRYLEEVAGRHVEATIADAIRQRPEDVLSFPNVGWNDQGGGTAVDITVAPLRMRGESNSYVLILVDTTERNALQREVEEFRRLAALGEFAAAIAHDIRTPLSSIRMSVQILRSKVELPPEDMEYFDLTLEAISRLGRDVEELLDFTKPAFLRVDMVALHEIAEDARDAVTRGVPSDVDIELEVPTDLEVPVDEIHVRNMLMNLMQNAVQASEPGGRVWLEAGRDGDDVRIVVRDEGRGIEKADLDRIWDPFFTTRTDGTGLGLALVRKTVTAHGGRVVVESEPGRGTRFEVFLPAQRETEVVVPIEEYRRQVEALRQDVG